MCADFCSDIKSLRSFLGAAYDKKIGPSALTSVRLKNQSDVIQQWDLACYCHTHNSSDKKSVRVRWLLVWEKTCLWQKVGRVRWLSPRNNRTFTLTFSRSSLRQKIDPCALGIIRLRWHSDEVFKPDADVLLNNVIVNVGLSPISVSQTLRTFRLG